MPSRTDIVDDKELVWDRLKHGIKEEVFVVNGFSNPIIGATYFNMLDKKMYVYDGEAWIVIV